MMTPYQQKKFDALYDQHINALRRQGKADSTIDMYGRSIRCIAEYFDTCPDKLTRNQLKEFFAALVQTHSWSTVKVDRNGLQFFYKYVLMPDMAYQAMRRYWATHRHARFLFPAGRKPECRAVADKVMNRDGLQKSFKAIVEDCKINKTVSIHTLRHTYGACLVEAGLHLRAIQHEMGHECPKTTALYTQLTDATHQNTGEIINTMVDQLKLTFTGET